MHIVLFVCARLHLDRRDRPYICKHVYSNYCKSCGWAFMPYCMHHTYICNACSTYVAHCRSSGVGGMASKIPFVLLVFCFFVYFVVANCDLSNCNYSLPFHGMLIGSLFTSNRFSSYPHAFPYGRFVLHFPFSVSISFRFVYGSSHVMLYKCITKVCVCVCTYTSEDVANGRAVSHTTAAHWIAHEPQYCAHLAIYLSVQHQIINAIIRNCFHYAYNR